MRADTRQELAHGEGRELEKIHSLRSSAALAVNVFEPWRNAPQVLGDIFGVPVDSLSFEAKQHIWPADEDSDRKPPHLDVLLTGPGPTLGIESKFIELYTPATNIFSNSYFPVDELDPPLWQGLEDCRQLAFEISAGTRVFKVLPAAQLLKHGLGLARNHPDGFKAGSSLVPHRRLDRRRP